MTDIFLRRRLLNPVKMKESLNFRKKLAFIRTRHRQNRHLWCHSGDMISPCLGSVFQLMGKVYFAHSQWA
jgi:hypothetical protein